YKGLKTKQKQEFSGSIQSSSLIIRSQDEVPKPLTHGGSLGGELPSERVVTKQRVAYQRLSAVEYFNSKYSKEKLWRKDNGENIMKSIKEGPFHMGTVSDVYYWWNEGQSSIRTSTHSSNYYTAAETFGNVKMILEGVCLLKANIEVHAIKNRNYDGKSPQPSNEPSPADNFQLDSGSSSTENLIESLSNSLALLTQSYKSHLPQTNNQLRTSSNARNKATVQDGRVVVQDVRGRYNANNQGKPFQRNNARGNVVAGNVGGQNRGGIINPGPAKPIKCYNCNGLGHIARECPRPKRLQDSDYFKDKMLLMQAQENGAVLDEEQSLFLAGEQIINFDEDVDNSPENDLALNMDHIFEADECDAFDSDVDEGPTTQTMFMTNLTSKDRIYDEAGTSYDSNTPFEVQDHDTFVNHLDEYHEVHEMQTDE
ncbi:retrovirus-related pol polyprotein from transposon TNT 1-94, partial [Tanacetum coccineum]